MGIQASGNDKDEGDATLDIGISVINAIATLVTVITVDLVPEWNSDEPGAKVARGGNVVEIIGSVASIAAVCMGAKNNHKSQMAFTVADFVCGVAGLVTSKCYQTSWTYPSTNGLKISLTYATL